MLQQAKEQKEGPSPRLGRGVVEYLLRLADTTREPGFANISPNNTPSIHKYLSLKWTQASLTRNGVHAGMALPHALPPPRSHVIKSLVDKTIGQVSPDRAKLILSGLFSAWMNYFKEVHHIDSGPFARPLGESHRGQSIQAQRTLFSHWFRSKDDSLIVKRHTLSALVDWRLVTFEGDSGLYRHPRERSVYDDFRRLRVERHRRAPNHDVSPDHFAREILDDVYEFFEARRCRPVWFEVLACGALIDAATRFSECSPSGIEVDVMNTREWSVKVPAATPRARAFVDAFVKSFDDALFRHLASFTPLYLGRGDLCEMGIVDTCAQGAVLDRVAQGRILGYIENRTDAVEYARFHALSLGLHVNPDYDRLCSRAPANVEGFVSQVVSHIDVDPEQRYSVIRYDVESREQFNAEDDLLDDEFSDNVNYAALARACAKNPELCDLFSDMLAEGKVGSLPELEAALRELSLRTNEYGGKVINPANLKVLSAASAIAARVERGWDDIFPVIVVPKGLQAQEHAGYGLSHIIHQRSKDGTIGENRGQFTEPAFVDKLLNALGRARFHSPSMRFPDTHSLLVADVDAGSEASFVFIVARMGDVHELISGMYFPDRAELDRYLALQIDRGKAST